MERSRIGLRDDVKECRIWDGCVDQSGLSLMVMLPVFVPNLSQPKPLSGPRTKQLKLCRYCSILHVDGRGLQEVTEAFNE